MYVLPDSGWVTFGIRSEGDVPGAIALFRLAYERAVAAQDENAERVKGRRTSRIRRVEVCDSGHSVSRSAAR